MRTIAPSICGGMNLVSPRSAMGLRISFRLKALASSLLRSALAFACDPHTKRQDLCGEPVQWLRTHPGSHTAGPHQKRGNVHLLHPLGNWTAWLRAFLVEATSTTNDHLFPVFRVGRHCGRLVGHPTSFCWLGPFRAPWPHQSTNFVFNGGGELEMLNVLGKGMCRCILFGTTMTLSVGSITSKPPINGRWEWKFLPPGAHTLSTAVQGPLVWWDNPFPQLSVRFPRFVIGSSEWGQPQTARSHGLPLGLYNTQERSCLSSVLIGYAVGSTYAELMHIHRRHHSRISKQEERQGTPVDSHMMKIVMRREEVCNGNLRQMRISILWVTALIWWQVHNVCASAHRARTGVSCGSTKSKKWHNLAALISAKIA